jgi:hypothetical protein
MECCIARLWLSSQLVKCSHLITGFTGDDHADVATVEAILMCFNLCSSSHFSYFVSLVRTIRNYHSSQSMYRKTCTILYNIIGGDHRPFSWSTELEHMRESRSGLQMQTGRLLI